jgi:hypothetical protein
MSLSILVFAAPLIEFGSFTQPFIIMSLTTIVGAMPLALSN